MIELSSLATDAVEEHDALRADLVDVPEATWELPTPSPGWTVRDQVSHLAFFDNASRAAVERPKEFAKLVAKAASAGAAFVEDALSFGRELSGRDLLDRWRDDRLAMVAAFLGAPPGYRMPWFGPDMGLASALTSRIMETWAHGQDVADCLGFDRPTAPRLRHVCDLGIRTRSFALRLRGQDVPDPPVRVELAGPPGGEIWAWGPADAPDRVVGRAVDFALVVTQRRHLDDTGLVVEGAGARAWMSVAQAFAGAPGAGRAPRPATVARMTGHEAAPASEPLDSAIPWVAEHTRRYVETGGAEGHLWNGVPTLVLTTRGRRSGKPRRNALIFGRAGEAYVVVGSKGGARTHPLWYLNLLDEPVVGVQVGAEQFEARARLAEPAERQQLWPQMASVWPAYEEYQSKTSRRIPVVVLERT